MGQSQSTIEQSRVSVPKINTLQFWKQASDIRYGDIKVYKLKDGHTVAVKDHIFQDEEQWNKYKLETEKQLTSREKDFFLISMIDLQHVTEKELCTQLTQAHSVYEYFDEYLERVINELSLSKQQFEEIEIVAMIHCTLIALQRLNDQQRSHGDIRPQTISVTSFAKKSPYRPIVQQNEPLAVFKLTDIEDMTDMNAFRRCVAKEQGSYNLSPEQLSFLKQRVLRPNYDLNKSDVFSIGLTALQMATLNGVQDIYDQANYSIKVDKLDSYILQMKTQYSEHLCSIVCQMLQLAPESRPSPRQAHELLIGYRFQLEDYFRMSTIADYIPNYSIDFRQTNDQQKQPALQINKNVDLAELYEQVEIIEQRAKVALQRSQDAQLRYQRTPGKQSRVTVSNWEPTRSYQQYNNLTPITQKELIYNEQSQQENQSNRQSSFFVKNFVAEQYQNNEVNKSNDQGYHAEEVYAYNQQELEEKPKHSVVEQVELTTSNLKQLNQRPNTGSFSQQQLFESINTDKPNNQLNNQESSYQKRSYQQATQQSYQRSYQQTSNLQNQIQSQQLTTDPKLKDQEQIYQLTGQQNYNNPAQRIESFGQNYEQVQQQEQEIYPQMEYQQQQQSPYAAQTSEQKIKYNRQLTGSSNASINGRVQSQTQINPDIRSAESQALQSRTAIPKQPNIPGGSRQSFKQ